jgi:tight adherence protein B
MALSIAAAVLAFIAVAGLVAYLFTRSSESEATERRLSRLKPHEQRSDRVEGGGLLRSGGSRLPLLRSFLAGSALSDRWRLDLEQAGLRLKVSEYFLMRILSTVVVGMIVFLLTGGSPVGLVLVVVTAAAGYLLPSVYVGFRKGRRRNAIKAQLVEMLEMVSNSLRSGFAFVQAIEMAAKQLNPPVKDELEAFLNDTSLGAKAEDALRDMADRSGSIDMELMVTTILVQRTSGGNLSEVLDSVAATIRERERLQGDIKALTASQRFTGLVLSIYPLLLGAVFFAISPGLMGVLWKDGLGQLMLAFAAFLQVLGIVSIRRILKLEV